MRSDHERTRNRASACVSSSGAPLELAEALDSGRSTTTTGGAHATLAADAAERGERIAGNLGLRLLPGADLRAVLLSGSAAAATSPAAHGAAADAAACDSLPPPPPPPIVTSLFGTPLAAKTAISCRSRRRNGRIETPALSRSCSSKYDRVPPSTPFQRKRAFGSWAGGAKQRARRRCFFPFFSSKHQRRRRSRRTAEAARYSLIVHVEVPLQQDRDLGRGAIHQRNPLLSLRHSLPKQYSPSARLTCALES